MPGRYSAKDIEVDVSMLFLVRRDILGQSLPWFCRAIPCLVSYIPPPVFSAPL